MMMKTILAVCFLPVWFLIYFMLRNHIKPKKNIIIGVTLPHSAHNDMETQIINNSYIKWLNIVMLPLLLLMIPPFFMQLMGAAMIWFMTWLLLLIAAPVLVFAKHRSRLMVLKRAKNWHSAAAGRVLVDIKTAALPQRKIKSLFFLPPVIAGLIPLVYSLANPVPDEWGLTLTYALFALMTIMFWLFYKLIYRLRSELLNENVTLNTALTRVRRYNWGKFWLIASWINGIYVMLLWFFTDPDNIAAFLTISLGYSLTLIAIAVWTEFSVRIAQQKLTAKDAGDLYLDEDEFWLLGMFYHNPNDRHFLVNDRIGMNMSVNLARPAGKAMMALSALCIAALPFFGVWIWSEELTPTQLILNETTLAARHNRDRYLIQLDAVESIELIETLPSMVRTAGMGLENLNRGNFRVSGYGSSRVCIQPNDPPFLLIRSGGNTYVINDADSSVTREVYAQIRSRL